MSRTGKPKYLSEKSHWVLGRARSRLRNEQLRDAVAAGCALVAYADGWVTEEERRRMAGLIRAFEPTGLLGLEELVGSFEAMSDQFALNHEAAERQALFLIAQLKGERRYSTLLVEACCAIATADGGFDAEERQSAIRICTQLGLDPGAFDLDDAP